MKNKVQAVILAGGLGTRLRPITEKIPKPMVPVAGFPFLHWQLLDLKQQGYTRVLLLIAYLGEKIIEYFGDGSSLGMQISYSKEPKPMGTGGALKIGLEKLEDTFVLLNGDSFLRAPLDGMCARLQSENYKAVVSVFEDLKDTPVIPNTRIAGHAVTGYEKDAGIAKGFQHVDSGVYVIRKEIIYGEKRDEFMLADLWPPLINEHKLGAYVVREKFYDIGTPERLAYFESQVPQLF